MSNEDGKRCGHSFVQPKTSGKNQLKSFQEVKIGMKKNLHKTLTVDFLAEISRMLEAKVCFLLSCACYSKVATAHKSAKLRMSSWLFDRYPLSKFKTSPD